MLVDASAGKIPLSIADVECVRAAGLLLAIYLRNTGSYDPCFGHRVARGKRGFRQFDYMKSTSLFDKII
jgi:hypothetical protein